MLWRSLALLFTATRAAAAASVTPQIPLVQHKHSSTRILTHESHPDHSLTITAHNAYDPSIKRNDHNLTLVDVCPGATAGYTGYLNSGSKHFYFAYFESRSQPEHDPLVLWLNGGPGCSSMTGLFMELGPCTVNEGGQSARENPNSWIEAANVFFLDQPIGVGFSYSSNDSDISGGTFAASEDIYAFMGLWYAAFPASRSLPFSIAGESYGGHYIPIFAEHIKQMNAIAPPSEQIPLESVIIGNGVFSDTAQASSYYDIPCTNVTGIGPLLNSTTCARMAAAVPRCEYLMQACHDYPDPLICRASVGFCATELEMPYVESGRNYYDISKPCDGYLCYPIMSSITTFLRTEAVRTAFGVDEAAPKFIGCSNKVGREFQKVNDFLIDTRPYVATLLHSGVRVLIYVGTYDWICKLVLSCPAMCLYSPSHV